VNLVRYWDWLRSPDALAIANYPSPSVKGILNFHGCSLYARVCYGKHDFRVLCNSRDGLLDVSVAEVNSAFEPVKAKDLRDHLDRLLKRVVSQHNRALAALNS
jgi:hypothetical protein